MRMLPGTGGVQGRGRTLLVAILTLFPGCTGSSTPSGGPSSTAAGPGPTAPGAPRSSPGVPTGVPTSAATTATPYSTMDELLRADPRDPRVRTRLAATAVQLGFASNLRYTALTRLALVPQQKDTATAAATAPHSLSDRTEDERWLVDNAIAVRSRVGTDQSRAALAALSAAGPGFKRDAVLALEASSGRRPQ